MRGVLPNLQSLVRDRVKNNKRFGVYNPMLPGGINALALSSAEYLEAFGTVQDNATKQKVPFRVDGVNPELTCTLLDYVDDPGFDENGLPYWQVLVSGRQSTKSTVGTYGLCAKAMREPGTEAFIIADTNDRSKYLYERAVQLYSNLPERLKPPLHADGTTRGLRFDSRIGGSLTFYSAERRGGMIGFSGKVGQISEIPFMQDPAKTLSVLLPALYHQTEARLMLESTPAPPTFNGAEYWKNLVVGGVSDEASAGGRFKVAFSPWWESKLNTMLWRDDWKLTNTEIDLLEKYGDSGLTQENLAYRRMVMDTDVEIRRAPDLFDVWYPSSLTTCWGGGAIGLFPPNVLQRHVSAKNRGRLSPDALQTHRRIIIGVDPAGLLGGADHAALCVIGCDQNDWVLLEVASARMTVHEFVDDLMQTAEKYMQATGKWPDVAVESNGVGAATLALLLERRYPRLYAEKTKKPGITASKKANARMVAQACDALMDNFAPLWSLPLVLQLQTYTGDRAKRTSELSMLINGIAKGRREKQHWDLASAFLVAVEAASNLPLPRAPFVEPEVHVPVREYTASDYDKLREIDENERKKRKRRR